MLGGLADYGSDSGSDSETEQVQAPKLASRPAPAAAEPPKKKRKGPLKIGLDLPKPTDEPDEKDEDKGPAPKPKKAVGAGSGSSLSVNKSMAAKPTPADDLKASLGAAKVDEDEGPSLVPAAVKRKAAKEEELDLFGLSSAAAPKPSLPKTTTLKPPSVTSAPAVADFVPPEPTAADPYPGYYQLPSGQWAAYDPAYYAKFFPATDSATDALRSEHQAKEARLGNWKELDDGRAAITEFDVGATIARSREEQAKVPQAAKPTYTETYNATGQHKGLANERHQLTSLLHSAFSQREELEERIRQNKKSKQNTQRQYVQFRQ
ncbi:hypothetical protein A1Q1_02335 [Trichosporon asahii var. asahii CBS 2479]|uniref:Mitotic checkpoint regulator, MAD2B-interacting-domain-containing protein n=1 Tax=Trichosporon asahii var. asahii (strain ATCC 90039 / CBS 2479 / JCM 2466 / KCTC 7840 / NBRC 103889/ NCYC 2677 / UAMH 7654) TaxID=1186058 RepID=J5QQR7_TRIAS|nr:hypothetical protein A1Q1_02335 [Trichosporon asahii var. asahii CBS 2479]EJT48608.1 hypothetical protein A1Q1_02335 [Trichosporon asahii var. asahii CBS 2479]